MDEPAETLDDLRCMECGYALRGSDSRGVCPECGTRVARTRARRRLKAWSPDPAASGVLIGLGIAYVIVNGILLRSLGWEAQLSCGVPVMLGLLVPLIGIATVIPARRTFHLAWWSIIVFALLCGVAGLTAVRHWIEAVASV